MKSRNKILVYILSVLIISSSGGFSAFIIIYNFNTMNEDNDMDRVDYDPILVTPIPIPFNLTGLLDFFLSLGIMIDKDNLTTMLDIFDGDFNGIDVKNMSALMSNITFANNEVFRVYNYTSLIDMEDFLWKYECYDQYANGTWFTSVNENTINFYTYCDYFTNSFLNPEILNIKMMNLTPSTGINQMTLPTLFPTPYIMENSVSAINLDCGRLYLRKQLNGLNGTALRMNFTDNAQNNLSYSLVGENLPTEDTINSSCVIVSSPYEKYSDLLNDYLQLDGENLEYFISNHSDFEIHYEYLNNNIINTGDNAFEIADKIRNYLLDNFTLNYNPIPELEDDNDTINWFCKSKEGMCSDFTSAFIAFTRAFGVVSRFVDGFNSRNIVEIWDPIAQMNCFAINYRNLYTWAEVFIPTDIYGNGYWAQFDILN